MNDTRLRALRTEYWRQTRNLTATLLLLWFAIVFGAVFLCA